MKKPLLYAGAAAAGYLATKGRSGRRAYDRFANRGDEFRHEASKARHATIQKAINRFPLTFGLSHQPGTLYRVSPVTYDHQWNHDTQQIAWLLTEAWTPAGTFKKGQPGYWADAMKGTPDQLLSLVVAAPKGRSARGRRAKKPTYAKARRDILAYLGSEGWDLSSPSLKVPHATSPGGSMRLYFKAQSVHLDDGGKPFSLGASRSMWLDIRELTPEQFLGQVNRQMRRGAW